MPVWRNWQTRTTQNRVPSGVPVRPRPLVSKRKKTLYTLYGVFFVLGFKVAIILIQLMLLVGDGQ